MVNEATLLNNHGVACFQAGELSAALDLFRQALQATIGQIHPQETTTSASNKHQHYPSPRAASNPATVASETSPAPAQQQRGAAGEQGESSVWMLNAYARAINLIPTEMAYSQDALVNATIVSSIVLFNLALVYHVKGLDGFDNVSQARLIKARSLYMKVRTLLTEAGISDSTSSGNPVIDILTMASLNNLGQSAYYLSEYEQSQAHFEELVRYASSVKPSPQDDEETHALLEFHKSMFLFNAVALKPPTLASAA